MPNPPSRLLRALKKFAELLCASAILMAIYGAIMYFLNADRITTILIGILVGLHLVVGIVVETVKCALSPDRFPCPCCRHRTLHRSPPGTGEICPVCVWEDDPNQSQTPDSHSGPNRVSLAEARENYRLFAASDRNLIPASRPPLPEEQP